jgi:peptide/nickel transport system permease protein
MALSDAAGFERPAVAESRHRWRLSSITPASRYYWVRLMLRNRAVVISAGFIVVICLLGVLAPAVTNGDPNFVDPVDRLKGPSSDYWFGTDDLGRDVYTRVIYGARISLLVGISVMAGATILGSIIGLVAGYFRHIDTVLMRVMDGLEAFPSILLAIAIMATFGSATKNVILALSVVFAPNIARLVRSTTIVNREQPYVESARAIGMRDVPIMWRYIFMNSLSPIIVQATFVLAFAILAEASLSFLGAGVPPETPTWGSMVSSGQPRLQQAWWVSVFPGTFLFLTVLAFNLIGDGFRDALDPRTRRR